jgi:L-2-hydroxyglutarate oxidase LhgO
MSTEFEIVVIGAGVVGLACAAELARTHQVLVLERHPGPGRETSSRNSEVVHAGLYYPAGSLKAICCVEGREELYSRCRARAIPHRRVGKYVVATRDDEIAVLERLQASGRANGAGVEDIIDGSALARSEPRVRVRAALWSPQSGIVDAHALISSYHAECESAGGTVVFRTRVCALERKPAGWMVHTEGPDGDAFVIEARAVVNAAGLAADRIAELAGVDIDALRYRMHPCKGDYFSVAPALGALAQHLIYPVPVPGGLGIHITLDMGGRYRLGPDVEYVEAPRYDVDPGKAEAFAESVRRYLPELRAEDLAPDFAGIRPKLQGPGETFRDYVIEEASHHGAPGLWNLLGIESPGLTASSAIARRVAEEVARAGI